MSATSLSRRVVCRTRAVFLILAGTLAALAISSVVVSADEGLSAIQARTAPEWLTRGVMYQVWLRSFTPEGTLAAATKRLPEVAKLDASIVYLCPICLQDADMRQEFWSERQKGSGANNPRNPYRIADYNRVDPEYGSEDDLRAFVSEAHRLGLRVLLDLVYFHCGPTSVLMEHPEFFKHDASGQISTGEWHFPVLNFENRGLREYLWANMEHWIKDFDFDGFRCDVADKIPLDFWEEARVRLDALRPGVVILSEGQRKEDQLRAFDLNYGFSWYSTSAGVFHKSKPASSLRAIWEEMARNRPRGARIMRYTENHDIVNDRERADVVFSRRGANAMAVINFTLDGVPLLYNGQEIGDTTVQSIFARYPIRWEAACLPEAKTRYAFFNGLCRMRRTEPVLTNGEVVWLDNDRPDAVVSFLRRSADGQIVCVMNLSNRRVETQVTLPEGAAGTFGAILKDGAEVDAAEKKLVIGVDGFGYFVGKGQ